MHNIYGYRIEGKGVQSFPKPLNAKEEKECIKRLRSGDKEARKILIEKNLRLVAYVAKRYVSADMDMEELISIGSIGLIKGIDNFKEDKQIRLATFCSKCIENEMLMYFRSTKKQAKDVYLNEPIGADKEGNEISLIDILESIDEDVSEKLWIEDNLKVLKKNIYEVLTPRERKIIFMRYGIPDGKKEYTQREVAAKLGISRSYVSRIEKRALDKLKRKYEI